MTTANSTVAEESAADDRLERFRLCSSAEDYFDLLQVTYDPRVLHVYRLHILRHFAGQMRELHRNRTETASSQVVLDEYRTALAFSYQTFVTDTALDHRLFKVLEDHRPQGFVPIGEVGVAGKVNGS